MPGKSSPRSSRSSHSTSTPNSSRSSPTSRSSRSSRSSNTTLSSPTKPISPDSPRPYRSHRYDTSARKGESCKEAQKRFGGFDWTDAVELSLMGMLAIFNFDRSYDKHVRRSEEKEAMRKDDRGRRGDGRRDGGRSATWDDRRRYEDERRRSREGMYRGSRSGGQRRYETW